jgi:hypothetical protein
LTDVAADAIEREGLVRKSLMSHALRRMQLSSNQRIRIIKLAELPSFWRYEKLPSPMEQSDRLILWVGDNQESSSTWVESTVRIIAATIGIAISPNSDGPGFAG